MQDSQGNDVISSARLEGYLNRNKIKLLNIFNQGFTIYIMCTYIHKHFEVILHVHRFCDFCLQLPRDLICF